MSRLFWWWRVRALRRENAYLQRLISADRDRHARELAERWGMSALEARHIAAEARRRSPVGAELLPFSGSPNSTEDPLCECGHAASEHAEGWVCTHRLDDPEDGWAGVCPCVRRNENGHPDRMVAS